MTGAAQYVDRPGSTLELQKSRSRRVYDSRSSSYPAQWRKVDPASFTTPEKGDGGSRFPITAPRIQLPIQQKYPRACARLEELAELELGWAGPDSSAPSIFAIHAALTFLEHLPANIPEPYPVVVGDGELNLFWEDAAQKVVVDLGFDEESGTYNYYAHDAEVEIANENMHPSQMDQRLLELITKQKDPERLSQTLWETP